jgi:hypothetical protein
VLFILHILTRCDSSPLLAISHKHHLPRVSQVLAPFAHSLTQSYFSFRQQKREEAEQIAQVREQVVEFTKIYTDLKHEAHDISKEYEKKVAIRDELNKKVVSYLLP